MKLLYQRLQNVHFHKIRDANIPVFQCQMFDGTFPNNIHILTDMFNSHPGADSIYETRSIPYIEFVRVSNAAIADGCWLPIFVRCESSL